LPNDRDVTVYLPPGYEENGDRSYPVLYMNDGQNLFGSATSFAKGLRAKGWRPGTDLRYERIPGGTHDEAAWSQRVRPMLRFLFPA
jgi:enterochelin esterase-like enzyme